MPCYGCKDIISFPENKFICMTTAWVEDEMWQSCDTTYHTSGQALAFTEIITKFSNVIGYQNSLFLTKWRSVTGQGVQQQSTQ